MPGWSWVLIWWLMFSGIHLVFSSLPVRQPMIARLGARGFRRLYSLGVLASLVWSRALGLPLERPKSVTTEWIRARIAEG